MTPAEPTQELPAAGSETPPPPLNSGTPFPRWPALWLAVVTLWLYWPATHYEFVDFDDPDYVTLNEHVNTGLSPDNIIWAFTSGWAANWHPLTWMSLMLDANIYGPHPGGFHFTNIVFHTANVVLLFWLLWRVTGAIWRSVMVAALFGWHPMHVESVAWIAERKDVLSTFFGFLSLLFYVAYAKKQAAGQAEAAQSPYRWAWICLALGLLSKAMLVTWPFVMLLLDYWPLARWQPGRTRALVREKIPFFAVVAAAAVVTFLVQRHAGAVVPVTELPLAWRCENVVISYFRYLLKLCLPTHLAMLYPHQNFRPPFQLVLLLGSFLGGLSLLFILARRRLPFLIMGWLWFFGTLVPVVGFVQVGEQSIADRYTYIPSVGLWILMVWGVYHVTRRWPAQPALLAGTGLAVAFLCFAGARHQLGFWRNSETVFRHTLAVTKNNYVVLNNLGAELTNQGKAADGVEQLREAVRVSPKAAILHYNLGISLYEQGKTAEGIAEFKTAIRLRPNYADPHYNLGLIYTAQGNGEEAMKEYREAIRLNPYFAKAHQNLGTALADQGKFAEAAAEYQAALEITPEDPVLQTLLRQAMELKNNSLPMSPEPVDH